MPIGQESVTKGTGNRTTTKGSGPTCWCGKTCKNEKGLKIHQSKMGCGARKASTQRTVQTGKTQEAVSQDANHSRDSTAGELPTDARNESDTNHVEDYIREIRAAQEMREKDQRKPRVKWLSNQSGLEAHPAATQCRRGRGLSF